MATRAAARGGYAGWRRGRRGRERGLALRGSNLALARLVMREPGPTQGAPAAAIVQRRKATTATAAKASQAPQEAAEHGLSDLSKWASKMAKAATVHATEKRTVALDAFQATLRTTLSARGLDDDDDVDGADEAMFV